MFVNLNILSFGEQLRKSVFSFRTRIIISDNSLVHSIVNFASPLLSKIWAWWSDVHNIVHITVPPKEIFIGK